MGEEEPASSPFPWRDLPIEVQITVLGWLPLRSLFRLKSVCKLWNTAISSSTFTHFPSFLPCPSPWLIFFNPKTFDSLLAFDFPTSSWFSLDMRFLSRIPHLLRTGAAALLPGYAMQPRCLIWCTGSSCGRLLLDLDSSLHICNPLTKSVVKLPPFDSIEVPVTQGFSTTHMSGHDYTVVVVGKAKTGLVFEEFRASMNSWEVLGSLPSSFIIRHDQMMECSGLLYSLLLNPFGMLVLGEGDDTGGSNWRIQSLPAPHLKESCRLLACQNTLFLVCTVHNSNSFVIWKFQAETRLWVMMDNMPEAILEDVRSISCTNWVDCVGVGNYICFRALGSLKILTLDLFNETWSWLPEVSHPCDTFFTRGLPFEPRLDYIPTL